ncbi:uncharacterized protein LOC144066297 isoform X2 [Stigmatopora argus]
MSDPAVGFHPRRRSLGWCTLQLKMADFPRVHHRRALQLKVTEAEFFWLDCTAKTHSSENAILETRLVLPQLLHLCSPNDALLLNSLSDMSHHVSTLCCGATPTGWKKN